VGRAMQGNSVEAGVEQHLGQIARSGIISKNRSHIVAQNLELGS